MRQKKDVAQDEKPAKKPAKKTAAGMAKDTINTKTKGTKPAKEKTTSAPLVIYDTNPFMPELMRSLANKTAPRQIGTGPEILIRDKERGLEQVGTVKFVQRNKVDDVTFVKIFATNTKMILSLTAPGTTCLMYLTFLLNDPKYMKKDHVRITWEMYQHHMEVLFKDKAKDLGMSRPTFYRGINDLIDKGALAPANIEGEKRGWFFINPAVIINGDRIFMIQEFMRANSERLGEWRLEQDPWNVAEKVLDEVPTEEFDFSKPQEEQA